MANSHSKYNPEYHRQWHLKNRARRLLAAKANYLANRERKLRKNAEYRKLHPEMAEKAAIKYRASHRQECRQRCRDWYQRNKEAQQLRSRIKNAKAFAEHREKILAQNRKWAANNKQKIAARDAIVQR